MNIRRYKDEDYPEICRWADKAYGTHPDQGHLSGTSFIIEDLNQPIAVVSILLTNARRYCIAECLLSNPDVPSRVRKTAIESLMVYVEAFAKGLEYKGLFCLAPNKALMRRYRQLGFRPTIDGVTTMIREI